ncbi:hypothetical protein ABIB68_005990 [Bradyrhizobium sp. F1.2.2]|jgi:hypothetical protein
MTARIAIATAEPGMFETLRTHLLAAGVDPENLHDKQLMTTDQTNEWLIANDTELLVLDAGLPMDPRVHRDTRTTVAAQDLLSTVVQARDPHTSVLVIAPSFGACPDLEQECSRADNALILPMDALQLHRHRILRPFIAMLTGHPDEKGAIPGAFRVIETEIHSAKVECRLGTGDDGSPMLRWNTVSDLDDLKSAARDYGRDEIPQDRADAGHWIGTSLPKNWLAQTRGVGTRLFKSFVVKAIGEHLFSQIERAAGGLAGLSFRFVINDAGYYPVPFEASVRYLAEENGPFVLLHAPIVRRVPSVIRLQRGARAERGRIEPGSRLMFVRSQVGEHPDRKLERVICDGKTFDKLGNIDVELRYLKELAATGCFELEVVDLSGTPGNEAVPHLLQRLAHFRPSILHYAGHAWSDGQKTVSLVLPGTRPEEAIGLKLDRMVASEGLSSTTLVYLSACRGISRGSVQQLVMNGIPYALGFRWNVEDDRAPHFAKAFYSELHETRSVCLAFRKACRASWERLADDEDSPIWLSPILLAQSTDWATRCN